MHVHVYIGGIYPSAWLCQAWCTRHAELHVCSKALASLPSRVSWCRPKHCTTIMSLPRDQHDKRSIWQEINMTRDQHDKISTWQDILGISTHHSPPTTGPVDAFPCDPPFRGPVWRFHPSWIQHKIPEGTWKGLLGMYMYIYIYIPCVSRLVCACMIVCMCVCVHI